MRPHQLTVAGIIFLKRAKKIISEASYAKAELAVQDLSKFTRLRLGVIEDFDANITPKLLMELSKEFTGCQIQLETAYSLKIVRKKTIGYDYCCRFRSITGLDGGISNC